MHNVTCCFGNYRTTRRILKEGQANCTFEMKKKLWLEFTLYTLMKWDTITTVYAQVEWAEKVAFWLNWPTCNVYVYQNFKTRVFLVVVVVVAFHFLCSFCSIYLVNPVFNLYNIYSSNTHSSILSRSEDDDDDDNDDDDRVKKAPNALILMLNPELNASHDITIFKIVLMFKWEYFSTAYTQLNDSKYQSTSLYFRFKTFLELFDIHIA